MDTAEENVLKTTEAVAEYTDDAASTAKKGIDDAEATAQKMIDEAVPQIEEAAEFATELANQAAEGVQVRLHCALDLPALTRAINCMNLCN